MNFTDLFHQGLAASLRRLPRVRGTGRLGARLTRQLLPRLGDPVVKTRMRDGTTMMLDVRSRMETEPFWTGDYEVPVLKLIKTLVGTDGMMLDVGANVGFVTVSVAQAMKKAGGQGRIISFEPVASNFQRLSRNVEMNHLDDRVRLLNNGLGSEQTTVQISMENANGASTGNAVLADGLLPGDNPGQKTTIKIDRLDNVWPTLALDRLDFVKVDIEGAEIMFLRGAMQTIEKCRPDHFRRIQSLLHRAFWEHCRRSGSIASAAWISFL